MNKTALSLLVCDTFEN